LAIVTFLMVGLSTIVALPLDLGMSVAEAYKDGKFEAPVYDAERNIVIFEDEIYKFDKAGDADWDDNGTKETHLERFFNSKGQKILRAVKKSNGEVWAWAVYKNPCDKRDINNYSLVDTTGDGAMNRQYGRNEDVPLPNHV